MTNYWVQRQPNAVIGAKIMQNHHVMMQKDSQLFLLFNLSTTMWYVEILTGATHFFVIVKKEIVEVRVVIESIIKAADL